MTTLQFDTSGEVYAGGIRYTFDGSAGPGPHLSPFVQGYVEAMFAELDAWIDKYGDPILGPDQNPPRFSDLATETLARIMEDCEQRLAITDPVRTRAIGGRLFWLNRNAGVCGAEYPPLTVYLGDDGKVYLRDTSHA